MSNTRAPIVIAAALAILAPAADLPRQIEGWGVPADPDGDCTFRADPANGSLTIVVPGSDRAHLLSAEVKSLRLNAPRVLRPVKGDFEALVLAEGPIEPGFEATSTYAPYHGAGLLVFQDKGNYVRLERAAYTHDGTTTPYVNFEVRRDDRLISTRRIDGDATPKLLRLSRRGDLWHASFSADGKKWTSFPGVKAALDPDLQVGVAAINASRRTLSATLRNLRIDAGGSTPAAGRPGDVPPPPVPGSSPRDSPTR